MVITLALDPHRFDNAVHSSMHVLNALISAGIPALGVLGVTCVAHGVLTISAPDLDDGRVTYTWRGDGEAR